MVFMISKVFVLNPNLTNEKDSATTPVEILQSKPGWDLYEKAFDNCILNREKPFPASRLGWTGEEIVVPEKKDRLPFNSLRARWKISRETRTESPPTDESLKATSYRDVASIPTMAEMSQRIDNLTIQMTEFTKENSRQVRILKDEINGVVSQLICGNNRLRDMTKGYHGTSIQPRAFPFHAASSSTISLLPAGSPVDAGLDMVYPNPEVHLALQPFAHQPLSSASPALPEATLPMLPTSTPGPPLLPPRSGAVPLPPTVLLQDRENSIDLLGDVDSKSGKKESNANRFF